LYDANVSDFFRPDAADLAEDARLLLIELDREAPGVANLSGECRPPLDVLETTDSVEVVVDVPGIAIDSIRVAVRRSTVLVVGAKLPASGVPGARFHLAERAYGRFARAVKVSGAIDASRASATVTAGQLRVIVPRIADRRGQVIMVPVSRG
jgi:HSP20 family protein